MEAGAGRIGEHVEHIAFGFLAIVGNHINLLFFPLLAPLAFDALDLFFAVLGHLNELKDCKNKEKRFRKGYAKRTQEDTLRG